MTLVAPVRVPVVNGPNIAVAVASDLNVTGIPPKLAVPAMVNTFPGAMVNVPPVKVKLFPAGIVTSTSITGAFEPFEEINTSSVAVGTELNDQLLAVLHKLLAVPVQVLATEGEPYVKKPV